MSARSWRELLKAVSVGVIGSTWINDNVAHLGRLQGPCMLPTLTSEVNWFVSRGINGKYDEIQRGNIVEIRCPEAPQVGMLKRVIALEGDFVDCPGRDHDYDDVDSCDLHDPFPRVPQGHCWVEGDNYGNSYDSKYYGPLPLALVFGKLQALVHPEQGRPLYGMDKATLTRVHRKSQS